MAEIVWTDWITSAFILALGSALLWLVFEVLQVSEQIPKGKHRKHVSLTEILHNLGIDFGAMPAKEVSAQLLKISSRCASCTYTAECHQWNFGELSDVAFLRLCPNASVFENLQHQQRAA